MTTIGMFFTALIAIGSIVFLTKRVKEGWSGFSIPTREENSGNNRIYAGHETTIIDHSAEVLVFEDLSTGELYEVAVSDVFSLVGRHELGGKDTAISRSHMNICKKNGHVTIIPEKLECPVYIVDNHLNIKDSKTTAFTLEDGTLIKLGKSYFRVYDGREGSSAGKTVIGHPIHSGIGPDRKFHRAPRGGTKIFGRG